MFRPRPKRSFILTSLALLILLQTEGCFFYFDSFSFEPPQSHASLAESLVEQEEYAKAIEEYQLHIQLRQADPRRPENENPYFYYLLIGDLHLELDDAAAAERFYLNALENGANKDLSVERLKRLGRWHAEREEYEEAFDVLQRHRELDAVMFDLEIDRIHKESVQKEMDEEFSGDEAKSNSDS